MVLEREEGAEEPHVGRERGGGGGGNEKNEKKWKNEKNEKK